MKNEYSLAIKRPFAEEHKQGETDHERLWGNKLPRVEPLPSRPESHSVPSVSPVVMNTDTNNNTNDMKEEEVSRWLSYYFWVNSCFDERSAIAEPNWKLDIALGLLAALESV